MTGRWSFFEFDWERFRQVRPKLKTAFETRDFTALDWPEALDLFEHTEESMPPEVICNELVVALCAAGDPLLIEGGLPATILRLRKLPLGEEPGDVLAELISAEPGIEDWFRVTSGLTGILSGPTTEELSRGLAQFKLELTETRPQGIAAITRRLSTMETARDPLQSLIRLVERATEHGFGVAAFKE